MNRNSIKGPLKAGGSGSKGVEARMEETAARSSGSLLELPTMAGSASGTTPLRMMRNCKTTLPLITQARRFRHHRVPVALHAGKHASNIVAEVHSFSGREHFQLSAKITLSLHRLHRPPMPPPPGAGATGPPNCAPRSSAVLKRLVQDFLQGLPGENFGQN